MKKEQTAENGQHKGSEKREDEKEEDEVIKEEEGGNLVVDTSSKAKDIENYGGYSSLGEEDTEMNNK